MDSLYFPTVPGFKSNSNVGVMISEVNEKNSILPGPTDRHLKFVEIDQVKTQTVTMDHYTKRALAYVDIRYDLKANIY